MGRGLDVAEQLSSELICPPSERSQPGRAAASTRTGQPFLRIARPSRALISWMRVLTLYLARMLLP